MGKRTKELFEILNRDRGAAPASPPRSRQAEPSPEVEPERSSPESAATHEPQMAPRRDRAGRRRGFGGRKVAVSLNVLLLFIGAFVVTNVCSYIVGKGMSDQTEVPLATEMRLFFAVKVTPPVATEHSFAVWELRDRLHDAGFSQTEVLGLDNGNYLQVVAGRFARDRRADCEKLEGRVRAHLSRDRLPKRTPGEFEIPIDIRTITISYTPYPQREPGRAP